MARNRPAAQSQRPTSGLLRLFRLPYSSLALALFVLILFLHEPASAQSKVGDGYRPHKGLKSKVRRLNSTGRPSPLPTLAYGIHNLLPLNLQRSLPTHARAMSFLPNVAPTLMRWCLATTRAGSLAVSPFLRLLSRLRLYAFPSLLLHPLTCAALTFPLLAHSFPCPRSPSPHAPLHRTLLFTAHSASPHAPLHHTHRFATRPALPHAPPRHTLRAAGEVLHDVQAADRRG